MLHCRPHWKRERERERERERGEARLAAVGAESRDALLEVRRREERVRERLRGLADKAVEVGLDPVSLERVERGREAAQGGERVRGEFVGALSAVAETLREREREREEVEAELQSVLSLLDDVPRFSADVVRTTAVY